MTSAKKPPAVPPMDAGLNFYCDPRLLTDEMVDPLIRPSVRRINQSGRVWTAESCQGHPDDPNAWAGNKRPMLRLICHRDNLGRVLRLLYRSSRFEESSYATGFGGVGIEVWPYPRRDGPWDEMTVYVLSHKHTWALAFWERFAEAVNS